MVQLPNENNAYYWRLVLRDGREVDIPPDYVELVKKKMSLKEPITTTTGVIPFSLIVSFDQTSRRHTDTALLEGASQAFREPLLNMDGEVKARWVKKQVSKSEYDRKVSKSSNYYKLYEDGGMVTVGFLLPVHMFDSTYMSYCTDNEEQKLDNQRK